MTEHVERKAFQCSHMETGATGEIIGERHAETPFDSDDHWWYQVRFDDTGEVIWCPSHALRITSYKVTEVRIEEV